MDQLRYTFGDIPPKEKEDYHELQQSIQKVRDVRKLVTELSTIGQEVAQCQVDYTEKQKNLVPLIKDYENKLTVLKRKADDIRSSESVAKKKKLAS